MSLSAQGGSGQPEDKPQGLSKFMRRASKVLKIGSSKRGSISGITDIQAGSGSDAPTALASQPSRYAHQIMFTITFIPFNDLQCISVPARPVPISPRRPNLLHLFLQRSRSLSEISTSPTTPHPTGTHQLPLSQAARCSRKGLVLFLPSMG